MRLLQEQLEDMIEQWENYWFNSHFQVGDILQLEGDKPLLSIYILQRVFVSRCCQWHLILVSWLLHRLNLSDQLQGKPQWLTSPSSVIAVGEDQDPKVVWDPSEEEKGVKIGKRFSVCSVYSWIKIRRDSFCNIKKIINSK